MAQTVGGYPDPTGSDLVDCHALTMTLPGAGAVDLSNNVKSFQTEKELTSDLPDGTRLQSGYPSASASFTLAGPYAAGTGESQDMGWLFGRYSTDSPLYHASAVNAPVTLDAGLSGVLVRQFTGMVDSYTVKPDGTVDVTCIDKRSLLRSVAKLPPVVTLPPYNAGLTSEYAIDALLRAARPAQDISTWPARRANCVFAVGFRTSLWPEIGTLDAAHTQPAFTYAPGAFGSALHGAVSSVAFAQYKTAATVGASVFCEWWLTGANTGSCYVAVTDGVFAGSNISVTVSSTGFNAYAGFFGPWVWNPSGGVTAGAHHVGFSIAAGVLTLFFDGQTHTVGSMGTTLTGMGYVQVSSAGATVEAVQVTAETSPTFTAFTPTAVLDPSLNSLQIIPEMSGDPWNVLQQIATAELGVCGFDELGIFRFRNRKTIQAQPLSGTIQSTGALVDLDVQTSAASVANRCQVDATPWEFQDTSAIYQHSALTRVPAHGSVTLTPTLDALAVETDGSVTKLPDGWPGTAHSYYRVSTDRFGNTEHPGVRFVVTQPSSSQLRIVVYNDTAADAWLVSPANYTDLPVGTVVLYIAGRLAIPSSTETKDFQWPPAVAGVGGAPDTGGAASTVVGEIAVQITGNSWIQDPDTAQLLAQDVVLDQCVARDTFDNVSVVPDHQLQLTDRRLISDTSATGANEYVYVFGAALSYDGTSQSQTLTVRTLAPPAGWLVGVAGRSEIGSGINQGTAYVYA